MKIAAAALVAVMALAAPAAAADTTVLLCRASVPCKVRCSAGGPPLLEAEQVIRVEISPLAANGGFLVTIVSNKSGGTALVTTGTMCVFEGVSK